MISKIQKCEGTKHNSSEVPLKDFSHLIEHSEEELTLSNCSQSTLKTVVSRHAISADCGDNLDFSFQNNCSELSKLFVAKKQDPGSYSRSFTLANLLGQREDSSSGHKKSNSQQSHPSKFMTVTKRKEKLLQDSSMLIREEQRNVRMLQTEWKLFMQSSDDDGE